MADDITIAVVNDDTTFLDLMGFLIDERGWKALILREAGPAFEQLKEAMPNVVVVDIRMENPDGGWAVMELLTLDPATRHIPLIVCSAAVFDLRSKEDWLNAHGIDVLPKPFDIDDLYRCLDRALDQHT
ncbi:MAG: response regulator [Chloroflexota bacterium]|nr:response regulator [Chloroflexota bacterium]